MKKQVGDIYAQTLKTYGFLLIITLIIKLLGVNYFQANIDNERLILIDNIISSLHLQDVWYLITTYINVYIVASMTVNDNSRKLKIFVAIFIPLIVLIQVLKNSGNAIFLLADLIYLAIIPFIYSKYNKQVEFNIKNYILLVIIVNVLQVSSIIIRDGRLEILVNDFIVNFI